MRASFLIGYGRTSVRIMATEALVVAMAIVFFVSVFGEIPGFWDDAVEVAIFSILVGLFVRAARREARQRDQIDRLNQSLESKVADQTLEIRRTYEKELEARTELEKLNDAKDAFIRITQHQLRMPASNAHRTLEELLKERYGRLSERVRSAVADAEMSARRLLTLVDSFLHIASMRVGADILDIAESSLEAPLAEALSELRHAVAEMAVSVEAPKGAECWPTLPLDASKMREALFIVLENAIRYNHKGGHVRVSTAVLQEAGSSYRMFEVKIENSGLGISPEELERMAVCPFFRGQFARKTYPIGMGVGLSLVKTVVRAHRGRFSIESDGPGAGARVRIALPLERSY